MALVSLAGCGDHSGLDVEVRSAVVGPQQPLAVLVHGVNNEPFTVTATSRVADEDRQVELHIDADQLRHLAIDEASGGRWLSATTAAQLLDRQHTNHSAEAESSTISASDLASWTLDIRVEQSGASASTSVQVDPAPGVEIVDIVTNEEHEYAATLLAPSQGCPCPTIAFFGGSEGGMLAQPAAALASQGYAVVVVGYFASPGAPKTLQGIDIGVGSRAIDWALSHAAATEPVGAWGASRGSELVVEVAARDERVVAVVAVAPASHRWVGPAGALVWYDDQEPLAALAPRGGAQNRNSAYRLVDSFERALDSSLQDESARLPVDQVAAPLLLLSGSDDQLWPAGRMAELIIERRCVAGGLVTHNIVHEGAGHIVTKHPMFGVAPSNLFAGTAVLELGGTDEANVAAGQRSWDATRDFFAEHLSGGAPSELVDECER